MSNAELAYYEGHHCQHVADFDEVQRLERKRRGAFHAMERRKNGRAYRN